MASRCPTPWRACRPAEDHRGNLAAGAKGVGRPLNERDRWLAAQIGPALAAKGMLFVGLDVIGGFVTEINVTSPTGIRELDKQFGTNIGDLLIQAVERRLAAAPARAAARLSQGAGRHMARRALTLREGRAPVWDRLLTMLFLAGLLHGLIIVGLTFNAAASSTQLRARDWRSCWSRTSCRRLTRTRTATYLAQRTQVGSGNTRKAVAPRNRTSSIPTLKHAGTAEGNSLNDAAEAVGHAPRTSRS